MIGRFRVLKIKILRSAGFSGVAAPLLGFTMILLSIRSSPWFSWTKNALSDLGVSGPGSLIFNYGLVLTGVLAIVFSLGLYELAESCLAGRLGFLLFIAGNVFLSGIGIFPETSGRIHYYVSVAFFVSIPLSMLALGISIKRRGMKKFGRFSLASGSVAAVVWLPRWSSAAIPEALSAVAMGLWSSVFGLWMLRISMGQGKTRLMSRGNGMVSLIWSSLHIHIRTRSIPKPKPLCGTVPHRRRSRYQR